MWITDFIFCYKFFLKKNPCVWYCLHHINHRNNIVLLTSLTFPYHLLQVYWLPITGWWWTVHKTTLASHDWSVCFHFSLSIHDDDHKEIRGLGYSWHAKWPVTQKEKRRTHRRTETTPASWKKRKQVPGKDLHIVITPATIYVRLIYLIGHMQGVYVLL